MPRTIEIHYGHDEVSDDQVFISEETGKALDVVDYTCFDTDSDLTPADVVCTAVAMRNAELESHKTNTEHLELVNMYDANLERFFIALIRDPR